MPEGPGDKDDEQVAVRHADTSGGYITENQQEEKIMSDIQVWKRGSEATSEEQTDEWRKTVRFKQEAPNASASSDPYVALRHLVRCETPSRLGSVLVQKSGHVDGDVQISAMHSTRRMDEEVVTSEKCWSGIEEKIPEMSREVNWMNWLSIGHVSTLPEEELQN